MVVGDQGPLGRSTDHPVEPDGGVEHEQALDDKLEGLITTRYSLADVNQGYWDMRAGRNIRGVITFD